MKIVTLTTCYNRKQKTLAALSDLHSQKADRMTVKHVLVDDGSSDGTATAVRQRFPEVEIVAGTGNLYWAGGMRFGYQRAVEGTEFDFLFVYNDDARFYDNTLLTLARLSRKLQAENGPVHVLAAPLTDSERAVITYGGAVRASAWHPLRFKTAIPSDKPIAVDTLNMNAAVIPYATISKVGFLADYFIHNGADREYGLRVRKMGGAVWLAPMIVGINDRNPRGADDVGARGFRKRIRYALGPKKEPLAQRFHYYRAHGGRLWPVWWVLSYGRILMGLRQKHYPD